MSKYSVNDPIITYTYHDEEKTLLKTKKLEFANDDWCVLTYNRTGEKLTYEDDTGKWYMYTYDSQGIEDSYSNSCGLYQVNKKLVSKEVYEAYIAEHHSK